MTDAKDSQLCMYFKKKPLQLLAFQKETSSITDKYVKCHYGDRLLLQGRKRWAMNMRKLFAAENAVRFGTEMAK
jgi:hypothetical protein